MRSAALRLIGLVALAAVSCGGWLWLDFEKAVNESLLKSGDRAVFVVRAGMTARTIAAEMAAQGLLKHPRYFVLHVYRSGVAARLKSGEYEIKPATTLAAFVDALAAGKVVQHPITILEGWNFTQLREALEGELAVVNTLKGLADGEVMARIGHSGEHPEGRFFPDTYHVTLRTSDVDLLKRAYDRMARTLDEIWKDRASDLPYASPYETLIMASIVERETAVAGERAMIAGVFLRRLKQGMKLQTDPTVIYGLGRDFDGNLRRKDLERDTAYNTYLRPGLPPTPIAMPGGASLRAALHPGDGEALYFVARGDGSHEFSVTLEQHNRAVARFQGSSPASRR